MIDLSHELLASVGSEFLGHQLHHRLMLRFSVPRDGLSVKRQAGRPTCFGDKRHSLAFTFP